MSTPITSTVGKLLVWIALSSSSILLNACGSSTTPIGSTNTAAPSVGNSSGNSGANNGAKSGLTTNATTNSVVTPSFVTDPLTAFKRLVADLAMLNEFDMFFQEPPNVVTPTVSTGQDFRYINCTPTPKLCAGTASLTRTYTTAGTFSNIPAGTAHAFIYQSYQYLGFIQHEAITGTAYLTFPEGFTATNSVYQGKASLYIRLKAPGPVIEWDGTVVASNFNNEGSPTHRLSGNVEVSPSTQPSWALNIASWQTYGVVVQGSQLTLTESGQSAEVIVEYATADEAIIKMSYTANGQATFVRIKQNMVAGVLTYTLQ
jgi:hypothetical protein